MNCLKGDIILLPYPFTDLSTKKVRPAVVVGNTDSMYEDYFIVPLSSKTNNLCEGEFFLSEWEKAGLNVPSIIKRGCVLVDKNIILAKIGKITVKDMDNVETSLRVWLDL